MAEQTLTPAPVRDGAWRVLFVLSGNMVLDAVEVSVVLVALPSIAADLRLSVWTVQWLMTGFALGFAAMLLLGPRLTARFGLRRCYLGALLVFAAASVVGGLSDTVWILVAARLVKGGCAALTAPAGLTLIAATFPDGPPLRRAVSVYSLFGAAGFTLGLLLSGLLTPVSWHWTFLFPAPVALILLGWGLRVLPHTERRRPPRLPAGLWRHGTLVRSTLGAALLNGTYAALLLVITFQAAVRFGWGPGHLALALLPACVPLAVSVPFAGRLTARFGTAAPIAAGAAAALAGQLLLVLHPHPRSYAAGLLPTLLLVGAAFVLSFAALNLQATRGLPAEARGSAVPVYQMGVQLGGVLMLPLAGALLTHGSGYRPALLAIACAGATGALISLTGLRGRPPEGVVAS
ncbi:MFS transporter [Streptomyces sp. NBC_00015]|uniref:MFS transporter n=1 Tax=unclassified Streptomyces TaxID=2593676 RepID=UPI002253375A|nr:MFS transporter [Streptomyces sp. NBC_00103]MCX5372735.1 MFS transporter [Streptomyces sp. NBC_00103]